MISEMLFFISLTHLLYACIIHIVDVTKIDNYAPESKGTRARFCPPGQRQKDISKQIFLAEFEDGQPIITD